MGALQSLAYSLMEGQGCLKLPKYLTVFPKSCFVVNSCTFAPPQLQIVENKRKIRQKYCAFRGKIELWHTHPKICTSFTYEGKGGLKGGATLCLYKKKISTGAVTRRKMLRT